MRKYRLIKEYPGSPKLNTILTHEELQYCNWDEYYEEIVEKDYEILKIRCTVPGFGGYILTSLQNGKFANDYKQVFFEPEYYEIYQVRRLSDGEIFTIGDLVGTPGSVYPLKEFKIIDSENTVAVHYYKDKICGSGHYNHRLKNLKKAKQPLFTTEDGVNIFENDWYFRAATEGIVFDTISKYKASSKNAYPDNKYPDYHVNFSTKEAAEEYIIMNKPCLSINDILNHNVLTGKKVEHLEKLVQQKLNK